MKPWLLLLIFVAVVSTSSQSVATAQAAYRIEDFGTPDGIDQVVPIDINNAGEVLVTSEDRVFVFTDGEFQTLGGENDRLHAAAINESGTVSGWIEIPSDGTAPALEQPVLIESERLIEMAGERLDGRALDLDESGSVIGAAQLTAESPSRSAVRWTSDQVEALAGQSDSTAGAATAVNALGQITGWIDEGNGPQAVIWNGEDVTKLGAISGTQSIGSAINELGEVAGRSTTSPEQSSISAVGVTAFKWSDGAFTELPALEGQVMSYANDINDGGVVAGLAQFDSQNEWGASSRAVIWTADAVIDLNEVVEPQTDLYLTDAVAINDLGQVLCAAVDTEGSIHAVVLSILGN